MRLDACIDRCGGESIIMMGHPQPVHSLSTLGDLYLFSSMMEEIVFFTLCGQHKKAGVEPLNFP